MERASHFPLSVVEGSRALVGADGARFLLVGDAAWSLIAELDRSEVDLYLENRRRLGFNTVLVNLIEHEFSSDPPSNAYGDEPFTTPGDFATPNESYFEYVDWVLQRLADEGFLVFLAPAYNGWDGGSQGWWEEMVANGPDVLKDYGRYLGRRYGNFDNIVWVEGGDFDPPDPELVDSIAVGISETNPQALHTAHLSPDTSPREFWSQSNWLDIDNVYTYNPVFDAALAAYKGSSMPFVLMESSYENEHDVSTRQLRTQVYHALLGGATGHIFGNNPIWHFGSGGLYDAPVTWVDALNGPGSLSMAAATNIVRSIKWWELRPDADGSLLVGGKGEGQDRAVAAVAADTSWAVVYVPTDRTVTLDFGSLAPGGKRITWCDPTTAERAASTTTGAVGLVDVTTPGANSTDDQDWVVIIEST